MRLYTARVMHRRTVPVRYRFSYRVFNLLLDVDRIATDAAGSRVFSHNRFNLVSFHDRDHGPRDGSSLRAWIDAALAREADIDLDGGRVRLLCMPRVLGYGFNPLSVWYCEHRDGTMRAVLCEVHNTFGESHGYLLHGSGTPMTWPVRGAKRKRFHVSPLMGMDGEYRFRIAEPGEQATLAIVEHQDGRQVLAAAWDGHARPASDAGLVAACFALPFMTLKVTAMIHWQALLSWLRGAPFFPKPSPPRHGIS